MPNRMFIINRLSGMAYERLSGSNAAARCSFQQRAGGTGRWSACVCQSFSPRVYRQSFAKFVFRPTKRKAIWFQYGLVGRACRQSLLHVLERVTRFTGMWYTCARTYVLQNDFGGTNDTTRREFHWKYRLRHVYASSSEFDASTIRGRRDS